MYDIIYKYNLKLVINVINSKKVIRDELVKVIS